jgi:hypothetical protein
MTQGRAHFRGDPTCADVMNCLFIVCCRSCCRPSIPMHPASYIYNVLRGPMLCYQFQGITCESASPSSSGTDDPDVPRVNGLRCGRFPSDDGVGEVPRFGVGRACAKKSRVCVL